MKKWIYLCLMVVYPLSTIAQLSTHELPTSFNITKGTLGSPQMVRMPSLDMATIEREDTEALRLGRPQRIGFRHKVNYSLDNSGSWYTLPNGDRLWQFRVICPKALSVVLLFDRFWLPHGSKFFVYSSDKKQHLGAFTSRNNKGSRTNIRGFATGFIFSDDVVLEYYQPQEVRDDAIISLEYVVHGYRSVDWGEELNRASSSCLINVNCEEGQNWQAEKRAVAQILVSGESLCSGALVNTTDASLKPYLLTADHCLYRWINGQNIKYDAYNLPNLDHWVFYWNYEISGCAYSAPDTTYYSTNGATIVANYGFSDFALLSLDEDPKEISNYAPYYLGWDNSGNSGNPGVCIHHPYGDIKCISTVESNPTPQYNTAPNGLSLPNNWIVYWATTENGLSVTSGGSSGSPLFNSSHYVIGQLRGGQSSCFLPGPDRFGRLDASWSAAGLNSSGYGRRLDHWLDSIGTGQHVATGLLLVPCSLTIEADQLLFGDILIRNGGHLLINSDIVMQDGSSITIEAGGALTVDGGKLTNVNVVLNPSGRLYLYNDGTIETRNGFTAPTGSICEIYHGKIS